MISSIIPTRVHGVLDYLVGLLLIAAPWIFGFADNRPAMAVPVILGTGTIVYSLLTNYELGILHLIPMSVHLWIDLIAGVFLIASPWLLGFANRIVWPHVTVGCLEIIIVLISATTPSAVRPADVSGGNIGRPGTV